MRTFVFNLDLLAQLDAYCQETDTDPDICLNEALQDFLQCSASSRLETFRKNKKFKAA